MTVKISRDGTKEILIRENESIHMTFEMTDDEMNSDSKKYPFIEEPFFRKTQIFTSPMALNTGLKQLAEFRRIRDSKIT